LFPPGGRRGVAGTVATGFFSGGKIRWSVTMEIRKVKNFFVEPYLANLEKGAEARGKVSGERSEDFAGGGGDKVTVSPDALLMTEARRAAQNTPDVRAEKVEKLRIQVADGAYRPDSRLIAENLLREEPDLFHF
jgi:negative regulator of flagellin synthesis FlgM